MAEGVARIPYNSDAVEMPLKDGVTLPANISGLMVVGKDGTTARFFKVNATGELATQLPADAATETSLAAAVVNLADIETLITAGNVDLAAMETLLTTIAGDTTSLDGKDFATQTTLAAAAVDLAAIEVLITAGNVDLAAIETLITAGNVDLAAMEVLLTTISNIDYLTETTFAARVGEVSASPTANTVLDRLKQIQDDAAAMESILTAIRDTAGIKKITDPVQISDGVDDLAIESDGGLRSRLYDAAGNAISSVLKTAVRRLQTAASIQNADGTQDVDVVDINGVQHLAAGKTNKVDPNNSSTAQLAIDGVFAGTATDVSQYATVIITVHSDKASAVDGMQFQFSMDGTNWDDIYKFNLEAGGTRRFQFPVTAQFFRVHFTNNDSDATLQFRVQTLLNRENTLTSIHRVEDLVKEDRSAQVVKSAIIAQREGATVQDFYPIQADVSGNLKVTTIGSDIPSDPSAFVLEFLENGGSGNMRVDGSVTPVAFTNGPAPGEVWSIRELLLTFAADDFSFDGVSFGPYGALTNGLTIEIEKDSVTTEVFKVLQNEDWLRVPGRIPLVNNTGPKDVLGAALSFDGLVLNGDDGDVVRIKVQDDLNGVKIKYLTATLFAVKVI